MDYINGFSNVESSLQTWDKSYFFIVYNSLCTLLDLSYQHFDKNFWTYAHERYWSLVFSLSLFFNVFGFVVKIMLASCNELRCILFDFTL